MAQTSRPFTVPVNDLEPRTDYRPTHARHHALASLQAGRTVVYAVRLDDGVIKIGCTANLALRLNTLKCHNRSATAEVLGFFFGDEADEQAIHSDLIAHRARGHEYYHATAEVLGVVNTMREEFGLPPLAA